LVLRKNGNRDISPQGDDLLDNSHPPLTERLAYFKDM
jgi:hypothetical protein